MTKQFTAKDPQALVRILYGEETGEAYRPGLLTLKQKHAIQARYDIARNGDRYVATRKVSA